MEHGGFGFDSGMPWGQVTPAMEYGGGVGYGQRSNVPSNVSSQPQLYESTRLSSMSQPQSTRSGANTIGTRPLIARVTVEGIVVEASLIQPVQSECTFHVESIIASFNVKGDATMEEMMQEATNIDVVINGLACGIRGRLMTVGVCTTIAVIVC